MTLDITHSKAKKKKGKTGSGKNKKNWSWFLFLFLNFLAAFPLFTSYAAPYIDPGTNTIISFFGLAYPLFFVINALFILIWLFRKSWMFLFPVLSLAVGYPHINSFFRLPLKEKKVEGTKMKVLSYNVRLFDIYNWTGKGKGEASKEIFEFIEKQEADLVCFQEFYDDNSRHPAHLRKLIENRKTKNYHIEMAGNLPSKPIFGLATFSRFPVINRQKVMFSNSKNNFGIFSDLLVNEDTIRVFNVHLESLHFDKHDYALVSGNTQSEEELKVRSKRIFGKIRTAFVKRATQAEELISVINQSPYPVIVCGDFNDTPMSYVYRMLTRNLNDSFRDSGKGFQFTYAGKIPLLRIDYILYDHHFTSVYSKVHSIRCSDHYPVTSGLVYQKGI